MSQYPPPIPGASPPLAPGQFGGMMRPHRGVLILVLGILGIVLCLICGIIAWVMGNADLREMDAGRMDPEGRGLTQAGKICGMISVILACVGLVLALLWIVFVFVIIGVGAAGAAGGAGGTP